jgi:tRNA(Ile)-lysidine synthase
MSVVARFEAAWAALGRPPGRVLLGVSGGADSLALLQLMAAIAPRHGLDLLVAHVNHGLHPDSTAVATRVRDYAAALGIDTRIGRLQLPAETSEGTARTARYRWFREQLDAAGAHSLALAHHREDQAETVLLRALAGSGPAGLAAMLPVRGRVVRPLLRFGREELRAVVEEAGWEPWEDPANRNLRHTRSWLRQEVLPLLAARDPGVAERLVCLADQAAAQRRAWDAALETLPGLEVTRRHGVISVAATPLKGYDSDLARAVLQALARRAGLPLGPGAADRLLRLVREGSSGRWVPLPQGWRGALAQGRVRLEPPGDVPTPGAVCLGEPGAGDVRFGEWRVVWQQEAAPPQLMRDAWTTWLLPGVYTVRAWQPGDRIRPLGGGGSRLVVRCMQDARVPASERARWPVIAEAQGTIVWVPGVMRADAAVPAPTMEGVRVDVAQS